MKCFNWLCHIRGDVTSFTRDSPAAVSQSGGLQGFDGESQRAPRLIIPVTGRQFWGSTPLCKTFQILLDQILIVRIFLLLFFRSAHVQKSDVSADVSDKMNVEVCHFAQPAVQVLVLSSLDVQNHIFYLKSLIFDTYSELFLYRS